MEPVMGAYGKMPSRGDFVRRRLPSCFIEPWDDWLQRAIMRASEELGERWRQLYLNGPIWRFMLAPQVLGEQVAAGVMMPSIDSVQRHFPLTLVALLPSDANPFRFALEEKWFLDLEEIGLACLDPNFQPDGLDAKLAGLAAPACEVEPLARRETTSAQERTSWKLAQERASYGARLYPTLLDEWARRMWGSYSLWATSGSDAVEPSFRVFQGLPEPEAFSSLLSDEVQPRPEAALLPPDDDAGYAAAASEDRP
jgi:type VI secretion system protein ImpM